MRYAFVFVTIVVIWTAIILIAVAGDRSASTFLHATALSLTIILFWIGFRTK